MRHTIRAVRAANRAIGHHFFSPDTMRFFNSRVESSHVHGGKYFVTSERREADMPKRYTIRESLADGSIQTVGDFQAFDTLADAERTISDMLGAEALAAGFPVKMKCQNCGKHITAGQPCGLCAIHAEHAARRSASVSP